MDNDEAYHKGFIPTIYWYMGTQHNVWVCDNKEFCNVMKTILSAVYTSAINNNVIVNGAIFSVESNQFLLQIYL